MKAEVKCSSWSSWLIRARNTTGRTGRLLVGGGFVFSMMKNGIVNGNYEQSHEEKTDYKKANAREFKFLLERIQAKMEKEDSVMATKSLVDDFDTYITKLNFDDHATNGSSIATAGVSQSVHNNKVSLSFVSILQNKPLNKVVKIAKLRNEEVVEGAAVAIPFDVMEEVSSRFINTLYGYFIRKHLAFLLVENYVKNTWAKFGMKRVQLHDDFFIFQFNTKEDLKKAEVKTALVWVKLHYVPIIAYLEGRSTYARALIEVHAEQDLKESTVILIPLGPNKGHSLATIDIEYEWKPPRDMPTSTERVDVVVPKPKVTLKNSFSSLEIDDIDVKQAPEVGKDSEHVLNVSDSEVDEEIILDDRNGKCIPNITKGASTPVDVISDLYTHGRALWEGLSHHKLYVRNRPWCLIGDFNAPLFLEDTLVSSSSIDISMREFKECVDDIEVMDVNNFGLQFIWNQKPKGTNGILKKLNRVMANLEFNEDFVGAHEIFKPMLV
ncbi:hypothetical protein Tco_0756533 [Tanacetum coccineum]